MNSTVILGSCAVSAAIFLVLELNQPLEGFIKISNAPLRNAVRGLKLKRLKKSRPNKQGTERPTGQPGVRWFTIGVVLTIGVALSLGVLRWNSKWALSNAQFEALVGRWQRPDGGYVLAINSIAADGTMVAGYFNPNSIHVGKAEASRDADAMKVFVELRDVNYPGSTYTLNYDPASDQLKGIDYQAVERQHFPVAFLRMR